MLSKKEPCVVHGLSVFLFFRELQKIRPPARKKIEVNSGPDPLVMEKSILEMHRNLLDSNSVAMTTLSICQ
jgi:hypothetical protein